ncbi:MAG: FAD-dependent oxidoreductase [Neofamilia sp.]
MKEYELVVIGGGPAGLGAAIKAKKEGLENILVIERDNELGGILQQCIHNGFGLHLFKEELTGPEYAERFIVELKNNNIEYKLDTMVLDLSDKIVTFINTKEGLVSVKAKSIVLAMGCRERTRGALNIPGSRPVGVYNAGMAQKLINIDGYNVGKKVIILGSGDIGMIMARRLVLEGSEVIGVLARGSYAAGLSRNVVQCLNDFDIPLMLQHTIIKINGKERVESVVVVETDENKRPIPGTEKTYECDTVLLSVGLIPENELSNNIGIEMDRRTGGPIVDNYMETSVEGIFACGNVLHVHDIVDFVTEESEKAAMGAVDYIKNGKSQRKFVETLPGKGVYYIVPQKIRKDNLDGKIELLMRVDDIYENSKLVLKSKGNKLGEFKKRYMMPSEMVKIQMDSTILSEEDLSELTVEIEN